MRGMKWMIAMIGVAVAAGAMAGSLEEKAAEGRLSVRDFGARGDGVTGAQGGEKTHHLLHTKYKKLDVYHFEG